MNEIGAMQRAQLFADVDTLKEAMAKMQEGCLLLTQMDGKLIQRIEEQLQMIKTIANSLDHIDGRLDIISERIDMAVERIRRLESNHEG